MGRLRLRQGPSQLRLAGHSSWRASLILGLGLLCAAPSAEAAIGISGNTLSYTAKPGDENHVLVSLSGGNFVVADTVPIELAASPGGCTLSADTLTATCPAAGVTLIRVNASDGNDSVAIDAPITTNAQLFGREGDDTLSGGSGKDLLNGYTGDDILVGGAGVDTADYSTPGGGVNVNLQTGTSSGSAGADSLSEIENVTGSAGADRIDLRDGVAGKAVCGDGEDTVLADATIDGAAADCDHTKFGPPPETTIQSGPTSPTDAATVTFEFSSSEAGSTFGCKLDDVGVPSCASPQSFTDPPDLTEGDHTFSVAAIGALDDPDLTPATYLFSVDRTPPSTKIDSGPSGTTSTPTPTFSFSSEPNTTFECQIDSGVYFSCESPFTAEPLSNGSHTFTVRAKDEAGNVDQIGASLAFNVEATVAPSPSATTSGTVIFGSLVLISGRTVKVSQGRFVPVSLTCSGPHKCEGRLTVTSDKPIRKVKRHKKSKRLERLGSTRFSIEGNKTAKVLVPLSRKKVRLLRKLKRVKARATIREIDVRGHPRVSTRTFLLRAR
jgi:hypothetical protein